MILARFLYRSEAAPRRSLKWRVRYRIGGHTIPDIAFVPAGKPYGTLGLLFTHKNGDFGAVSVSERSCDVPITKVVRHI